MRKLPLVLDREICEDVKVHDGAMKEADSFGVEVELEGSGLFTQDVETNKYFDTHQDHSLRTLRPDSQAIEYVFKGPYNYDTTIKAVKLLFSHLNSEKSEVFDSYRTSLHVHLNFGRDTSRIVYNFITLSIIFDELFVSQNGSHRVGNNFCLRARDAEDQIFDLIKSIENYGTLWHIHNNNRYSSVNIASLMKFGTIEFRSMECTTDFRRIKHWIDTLQNMKFASRTFDNPQQIVSKFSLLSMEEFMTTILGDSAPFYMNVEGWREMLLRGVRLAQDLAYCCSWEAQASGNPVRPKPKVPKFILDGMGNLVQNPEWQPGMGGGLAAQVEAHMQAAVAGQPAPFGGIAAPWNAAHQQGPEDDDIIAALLGEDDDINDDDDEPEEDEDIE